jgi:hypothetical protein
MILNTEDLNNNNNNENDFVNNETCIISFDPYIFVESRKRGCSGLNSNSMWSIYQRQKIIQKTVRIPSSLYTMNLGGLSVYQHPNKKYQEVNWNQMSDRKEPHIQKTIVPSQKSTKHSYTSNRPGCQSPGGKGVDIKHNSYNRYLNKLKGKGPLRRGIFPTTEDITKITFNPAFPVYGGKTFKTSIVNNCNCPIYGVDTNNPFSNEEEKNIFDAIYDYTVGQEVFVFDKTNIENMAKIIELLDNNQYKVEYNSGNNGIVSSKQLTIINSILLRKNRNLLPIVPNEF